MEIHKLDQIVARNRRLCRNMYSFLEAMAVTEEKLDKDMISVIRSNVLYLTVVLVNKSTESTSWAIQ